MQHDYTFMAPDGPFHYVNWGGAGPLAHISHATGFCAGMYGPLAKRLGSRLRVLGMDDRGHGTTAAPADPKKLESWDVFAKDMERFFEHLNEPVIAMGHSRGAVTSMMVAIKRPDLVRAMILIDPTILTTSLNLLLLMTQKARLTGFIPIVSGAAHRKRVWPDQQTMVDAYRSKHSFSSWKDGFLEGYVRHCTEETESETITLCCEPAWEARCFAVCPTDVWSLLPRLQVPTLVLYGSQSDVFLSSAAKKFRRKVPHAVLQCFEDTSHFVPMERPDETAEAILRFLAGKHLI
ncbi:MAG: alpha/beta fold hydrolase [Desulfomonilaceae bacterium]